MSSIPAQDQFAVESGSVSQPPEPIFKPDAVYFDTNPLIAAGWPNASAQLLSVMQLIEKLSVQTCVPEIVQQELEEHRIRELGEQWNAAESAVKRLAKNTESFLNVQRLPPLPSKEILRSELRKVAADLTARFRSVPTTQKPLSEFLTLAINRGATFKEGGHGFQDAVILCSVLDHMKSTGQSSACLVSKDAAFQSVGAQEMIRTASVALKIVGDFNDLEKLLQRSLTSFVLELLADEQKILRTAIEGHFGELQSFVKANLEIEPSEIEVYGTVKRLLEVKVVAIEEVHAPIDAMDRATKWIKVFAELKVLLTLEVERYYSGEPDKLRVGRAVYSVEPLLRNAIRQEVIAHEAAVNIEAEAFRTENGYTDVKFTTARFVGKSLRPLLEIFKRKT